MEFIFEDVLPNFPGGALKKIYTELNYGTEQKGKEITIFGNLIITREIAVNKRNTEIMDQFPIDISFPKSRKVIAERESNLRITKIIFEFEESKTKIRAELELTNLDKAVIGK